MRLLLAFSVVICHVGFGAPPLMSIPGVDVSFRILPADLAVQCFFVISGFYMSLILGKRYSLDRAGLRRFYSNRLLRLVPTYWTILLLFVVFAAVNGRFYRFEWAQYFGILEKLPLSTSLWIAFTNVTMIGQDTLMFMGLNETGHMQWTGNAETGPIPLHFFILNPPAWSLSLELWFYMLAPWFAGRHWRTLLGVCVASLALRIVLAVNGYHGGIWGDRFFPSELLLFVGGMLLERAYSKYQDFFTQTLSKIAFGVLTVLIVAYWFIPLDPSVVHFGFLTIFAGAVPFLFALTKDNKWDRAIGELSYPLYLCHIFVQLFVFSKMRATPQDASWIIAGISIGLALAIHLGVELPIERLRRRLASKS